MGKARGRLLPRHGWPDLTGAFAVGPGADLLGCEQAGIGG